MVEPFLRKWAPMWLSSEHEVKRANHRVGARPGIFAGDVKVAALRETLGESILPEIGIGQRKTYFSSGLFLQGKVETLLIEAEEFLQSLLGSIVGRTGTKEGPL
ncbi:hypothetical protein HPP92_027829 [Vanilla planifolia]|uniref:Uncharacterized protein n=1 Tax=Vanilla planifolia TaxID=51239 RepID=A0A835P9R2_VANPL|nr:hypothetical protein HPP92_027829 [Vanilla planifolia]